MVCAEQDWSYLDVGISRGQPHVIGCRSVAPIRIINPRTQNSCCHALLSNFGGGMVDGDNVCLKVVCREGARLNIGSVGSLQVYESRAQGCSQTVEGCLERDALCVVNADAIVLHSGSRFEQKQEWDVHPESALLVAEWVIAGRLETGEHFAFAEYASEFTVVMNDHPLIVDRFQFQPDRLDFSDAALFNGMACILNVYMVGHRWAPLENILATELDRCRQDDPQTLAAIYPVKERGYILRALSKERSKLVRIADSISEFMSQEEYLGFDPFERKY